MGCLLPVVQIMIMFFCVCWHWLSNPESFAVEMWPKLQQSGKVNRLDRSSSIIGQDDEDNYENDGNSNKLVMLLFSYRPEIPNYVVNLDLPPEERWLQIGKERSAQVSHLIS